MKVSHNLRDREPDNGVSANTGEGGSDKEEIEAADGEDGEDDAGGATESEDEDTAAVMRYWDVKSKDGTRKVMMSCALAHVWGVFAHTGVLSAKEEVSGHLRHLSLLQEGYSQNQWYRTSGRALQALSVSPPVLLSAS